MFISLRDALEHYKAEQIAIEVYKGNSATYAETFEICDAFKLFCIEFDLPNKMRMAIVTEDLLCQALIGLAVFECCTLAPINTELSIEYTMYYLKLLKVNYIIMDELMGGAYDSAKKLGLGVIKFTRSEENNIKEYKFELIARSRNEENKNYEDNNRIAFVTTTSGTTSTPKIVPAYYETIIKSEQDAIMHYGFNQDDVFLNYTKTFRRTFIRNILASVFSGSKIVLTRGFIHKEILNIISEKNITWFTAAPAVLISFAEFVNKHGEVLEPGALKFVRSSGAPLYKKDRIYIESVLKVPVVITYGMTEIGNISSTYNPPFTFKEGSVGLPVNSQIKVYNGELLVKKDHYFPGYENEEDKQKTYFTDGWFHTGDEGYIDDDGYIFITGRIKEMINRGGEKVSPYELEGLINEHPRVIRAAVFPYPNKIGSENVGVVIVEKEKIDLSEIRSFLKEKISAYKIPTLLFKVDKIPVGELGKIIRKSLYKELMDLYPDKAQMEELQGRNLANVEDQNLSETEKYLIDLWKDLLKIKHVSNNDDFFELGGDSLYAAAVISDIESHYNIEIPINLIFEGRTISAISEYIDSTNNKSVKYKFAKVIKESGRKEPIFCIHTGDGEAVTYHSIGRYIEKDIPVYGFKFDIKKHKWKHPVTFDQIATIYADEIMSIQKFGKYHLLGRCYGGVLALKIGQELKKRGKVVCEIVMLDSPDLEIRKTKKRGFRENTYIKKFVNSVYHIKNRGLRNGLKLIVKKVKSFVKLNLDNIRFVLYKVGAENSMAFLLNFAGKEAALKLALRKYETEYYNGRVYYFKATLDKLSSIGRVNYWKSVVSDLQLVEIETFHNDMESDESMKFISDKISEFMAGYDD